MDRSKIRGVFMAPYSEVENKIVLLVLFIIYRSDDLIQEEMLEMGNKYDFPIPGRVIFLRLIRELKMAGFLPILLRLRGGLSLTVQD
jgi:hypothetical protein